MRDLIYFVAASVDGFIAKQDGSFDAFPWDAAYGADLSAAFPETLPAHLRSEEHRKLPNRWFDAVLMGRNTYEVGLKEGISSPYPTLRQYVFSKTMRESPDPAVELVTGDPVKKVRVLKQEPGKAIWLCGGGALAGTLYNAGLIDRLIVKVNPLLLGTGIPLLGRAEQHALLELTGHKSYASGHMVMHYRVHRAE